MKPQTIYIVCSDVTYGSYLVFQGAYAKKSDALKKAKQLAGKGAKRDGDGYEVFNDDDHFLGRFHVFTTTVQH